ncbi:hypothetical protein COO60DRAFT_1486925 [Scenedesmus sp. NREL 46B-D3]|nr:hypothetical protein COO60DRAFT_1486925 [Scenedesmus sp. NREL 46B-D3]
MGPARRHRLPAVTRQVVRCRVLLPAAAAAAAVVPATSCASPHPPLSGRLSRAGPDHSPKQTCQPLLSQPQERWAAQATPHSSSSSSNRRTWLRSCR